MTEGRSGTGLRADAVVRWLVAVCAFVLLWAAPTFGAEPSEIEEQLNKCLRKGESCFGDLEAAALAAEKQAKRSGATLGIQTAGKHVSFFDNRTDGPQRQFHTYLGRLSDVGYHVVAHRVWEGVRFVLVSEVSGEQFVAWAIPRISPSKTKMVSVSASEIQNTNGITIWAINPELLAEEWRYAPREYALYKFLAWDGDSKIRVQKYTRSKGEHCPKGRYMTQVESIHLTDGRWRLSPDSSVDVLCQ